jgi:hypothetical protein
LVVVAVAGRAAHMLVVARVAAWGGETTLPSHPETVTQWLSVPEPLPVNLPPAGSHTLSTLPLLLALVGLALHKTAEHTTRVVVILVMAVAMEAAQDATAKVHGVMAAVAAQAVMVAQAAMVAASARCGQMATQGRVLAVAVAVARIGSQVT